MISQWLKVLFPKVNATLSDIATHLQQAADLEAQAVQAVQNAENTALEVKAVAQEAIGALSSVIAGHQATINTANNHLTSIRAKLASK